jgi:hypothetical protein
VRSRYGGMPWDMEMLVDYSKIWAVRFDENEKYWWKFLGHHFPDVITVNPQTIGPLRDDDVILPSVDFHCSPVTRIAAKKSEFQHLVWRLFGKVNCQDKIDDIVWELRSSINPRRVFWDKAFPIDQINRNDPETRKKHIKAYTAMSQQLDSISKWYIDKVKVRKG